MHNSHLHFTSILFCCLLGITSCSQESKDHESFVKQELQDIIELLDVECGEVVSYELRKHLEYIVTCSNGETLRMHVSPEGEVNAVPHNDR